jgi:hypothetical protein
LSGLSATVINVALRRELYIVMAIVIATVLAAGPAHSAPPAAPQGATAFTVSGTKIGHAPPFPEQLVPGYFASATISRIDYPAALFGMDRSVAAAVQALDGDLLSTPGPLVAAGFSQGALAVAHAKKDLMSLPAERRPDPGRLTFVTIGDPAGPGGIMRFLRFQIPVIGLTPVTEPDTPYTSIVVKGEYDGWADFPDRPWNLVSVVNALLGIAYIHGRYETIPGGLDLSAVPAANITTTVNGLGGRTTTYLVPTANLPLVQPLRDIGVPERIVAAIEKPLKKVVDKGYRRNDAAPAAQASAVSRPVRQAPQSERRSAAAQPGAHARAAA